MTNNCEEDRHNITTNSASNDLTETVSWMENNLNCPICFCVFETPISLPCGHTFCKGCIRRALEVKYVCPSCRAPTPHGIWLSDENIVIKRFCAHFATITAQTSSTRGKDERKATEDTSSDRNADVVHENNSIGSEQEVHTWPLFQIPMLAFPGQPGVLNIFESRYLLLLDRALFGDRMFVIHESGSRGSIGILVRIDGEVLEGRYRGRPHPGRRRVARVTIVASKRVEFLHDAVELDNQEDRLVSPIRFKYRSTYYFFTKLFSISFA